MMVKNNLPHSSLNVSNRIQFKNPPTGGSFCLCFLKISKIYKEALIAILVAYYNDRELLVVLYAYAKSC